MYLPLGPGIGQAPVRYAPALVGRFAPQVGTLPRAASGGVPGPALALLAATALELTPGHLDLPLAGPDWTRNVAGAHWTYPDGTGGRPGEAPLVEGEPRGILAAFCRAALPPGHSESGTLVPLSFTMAGAGGECLVPWADRQGPAPGTIPSAFWVVRGEVAYEYHFTETWNPGAGKEAAFAHYRLAAIRSTAGESCRFTYGANGADFEAISGAAAVQVRFEAVAPIPPTPALDDGLAAPGEPCAAVPAPVDRTVALKVTYRGLPSCPDYTVTAVARSGWVTAEGLLTSGFHGAWGCGRPVSDAFRRNLQVISVREGPGSEAFITLAYGQAPALTWSGGGGIQTFVPTVLEAISLSGKTWHLDWRCHESSPEGSGPSSPRWSYGVDAVLARVEGAGQRTWRRTPSGVKPEEIAPEASGDPVRQARHFALALLPCRTYLRDRWELRPAEGPQVPFGPGASNLRARFHEGQDVPTFELDPEDLTLVPVAGQLTRWLNTTDIDDIHGRAKVVAIGLLGGGGGGSKAKAGRGAGDRTDGGDTPTGRSIPAIRAYDRNHSKPGTRAGDAPTGRSIPAIRAYDRKYSRPGTPGQGRQAAEANDGEGEIDRGFLVRSCLEMADKWYVGPGCAKPGLSLSSIAKGIRSLKAEIAETLDKIAKFKANPTVRPGMEHCSKELIKKQQSCRIKHLETEIKAFEKNIKDLENLRDSMTSGQSVPGHSKSSTISRERPGGSGRNKK